MKFVTYSPFAYANAIARQLDRVFDELTVPGCDLATWMPAVELQEKEDAFVLRASIPGIDAKDLDVQATREAIAISGEYRESEKEGKRTYSEFRTGKFRRVVTLPLPVQPDNVEAELKDGVLSLTLPKAPEALNRVVKVKLAADDKPELASDANG